METDEKVKIEKRLKTNARIAAMSLLIGSVALFTSFYTLIKHGEEIKWLNKGFRKI